MEQYQGVAYDVDTDHDLLHGPPVEAALQAPGLVTVRCDDVDDESGVVRVVW